MYLSSSDEVNNIDVNDTSQTRQGNELSVTSNVCKITRFYFLCFASIIFSLTLTI